MRDRERFGSVQVGRRGRWCGGAVVAALLAAIGGCSDGTGGTGGGGSGGTGAGGGTGGTGGGVKPEAASTTVSTSLALTTDDGALWVANPESDSVSVIDTATRALIAEIPLGAAPAVDPATMRFDPAITPRGLAIVRDRKVYVAGQSANRVYVLDAATRAVTTSIAVPAAPVSVAAAPDGSAVYVVSHEAGKVTKIDPETDTVAGDLAVGEHPWGVTASDDGRLFVTHILLDPGVSVIDAKAWKLDHRVALADQPRPTPFDKRMPNGVARGAYGVTPRPGSGELWIPHLLLAVDTPQPDLDFESTVFPTISTLGADAAAEGRRLLFQPPVAGFKGAFTDSVSGPRAVAFTPDGKLGLVALAQSEDVMVFDAEAGHEISLVRPLPSALLEGIVVDHAGKRAYVDGRNTHDVTVLSIDATKAGSPVAVDGAPIERLAADPMPPSYRLGQRLFYTANSAAFPITKNFWVACASCHIEGGSDGVTWLFAQGPRDTPSNAGGPINTGFLMRQGLRNDMAQYDETIRVEQGGSYDRNDAAQKAELDALADFVNYAIPLPQNPNVAPDGKLSEGQLRGQEIFGEHCASCHSGAYYTDSAAGNAELDFAKPIVLHDIGTCVTVGKFTDKKAKDVAGNTHSECDFDTPTLRGVFASAPYLHDGSARTLRDVVDRLEWSASLPEQDKVDLVDYLLSL